MRRRGKGKGIREGIRRRSEREERGRRGEREEIKKANDESAARLRAQSVPYMEGTICFDPGRTSKPN